METCVKLKLEIQQKGNIFVKHNFEPPTKAVNKIWVRDGQSLLDCEKPDARNRKGLSVEFQPKPSC